MEKFSFWYSSDRMESGKIVIATIFYSLVLARAELSFTRTRIW